MSVFIVTVFEEERHEIKEVTTEGRLKKEKMWGRLFKRKDRTG